jgi:hypothetical protein
MQPRHPDADGRRDLLVEAHFALVDTECDTHCAAAGVVGRQLDHRGRRDVWSSTVIAEGQPGDQSELADTHQFATERSHPAPVETACLVQCIGQPICRDVVNRIHDPCRRRA